MLVNLCYYFFNEIARGWGPAESVRLFAQCVWGPRFNLHYYWRNTGYTIFSSQRLHNWPSCWADLQNSSWNLSNLTWPNTMVVLKSVTVWPLCLLKHIGRLPSSGLCSFWSLSLECLFLHGIPVTQILLHQSAVQRNLFLYSHGIPSFSILATSESRSALSTFLTGMKAWWGWQGGVGRAIWRLPSR